MIVDATGDASAGRFLHYGRCLPHCHTLDHPRLQASGVLTTYHQPKLGAPFENILGIARPLPIDEILHLASVEIRPEMLA